MKYWFLGKIFPPAPFELLIEDAYGMNEAGINFRANIFCKDSCVEADVEVEDANTHLYSLRNMIERSIRISLDCWSYVHGWPADVYLDRIVFEDGSTEDVHPSHPDLAAEVELRPLHTDTALINKLAFATPQLQAALFSVKEAIRQADLTGMFTFRAVESIRDYFAHKDWAPLNQQFNMHRSWSDEMAIFAFPQRHGTDKFMSIEVRNALLQRAYAVIDRFTIYLRDGNNSQILSLPELYCDGSGSPYFCLDPANKNHK